MVEIRTKKGLSDKRISEITGLPYNTIMQWKRTDKNGYRYKLYLYIKLSDESKLLEHFNRSTPCTQNG
ncbi:hypothetical protein [Campylobacter hyointestinalis]|uniref:hypothetical protein n=2 Tax=Campylobacter hyointestinalis TaxID=198 RepID=UPI0004D5C36B|nr:hypothetical protein [Campylobacter hyointestinalis]ANE32864.1 hypothetical protein CHH_1228 [Campylobacter hyointestinalis subsp. hyointestinalis LMG 9260]KEA43681.1 hypothetical protein CR67_08855 [Campylobacter hyointestinalis subsp. hyointestinalis]QKF56034.1 hypothetical protein CHHT_1207 [Campylobacter hyointestinalis subsp. hyointestinalis]TXK48843.1 hypothetical protein A0Z69_00130 [Campylobacter hyointestinalis]SFT68547.1 hypothetical protein SAMN05421691_1791 [Campylobacter hyoint